MGSILIKASPDAEVYLLWSSVADAPTWICDSRREVLELLYAAQNAENPFVLPLFNMEPEVLLARVDEQGSSMQVARHYGFDSKNLRVGQAVPPTPNRGFWVVPRTWVLDYARALLADDEAWAQIFLVHQGLEED